MLSDKRIFHLLVATLLLLPLSAAVAPACANGRETCKASRNAGFSTEQRRHSPEALLSVAGHLYSSVSLQSAHSGGGGNACITGYAALQAFASPLHNSSNTVLRRWRLMSCAVHHAQLRALYPAHGFW